MKKILLSCLTMASMGAFAQVSYNAGFESDFSGTLYGQFGGGTQSAAAACNGGFGGQLAISSTAANTGFMVQFSALTGQTNNGQKVSVTANYKKAAGAVGTISLAYFVKDAVAGTWSVTPFGATVPVTAAEITTCMPLSGEVPSGALTPGKEVAVGVWFARSSGAGNVFVDDINFVQETVTTAPACTTINTPVAGSTVNGGNHKFTWASVPTSTGYKVTVGTTAGASDVVNTTVAGTSLDATLPIGANLFVKVVPYNLNGDAASCQEINFTTNSTIGYCGPIISTDPANTYPISSVTFNGVTKTSAATPGSPAYEDFTSTVMTVSSGSTFPINVTGTGLGTNRFGMTVWVDWNNDGDFSDTGEQYFTAPANFVGGTGAVINLTGNIAVPAGVADGNKRMRIKYNFSSSTTSLHSAIASACSDVLNGQAEDYTINVGPMTAVPSCATISTPLNNATNVAPNPTVITWSSAVNATGYKVYVGKTSGNYDVVNGVVATGTTYSTSLDANTAYFAKVVAYNNLGDATGCSEITFTTGNKLYCAATATSTNQTYERISKVQFAGINNASNTTPASSGVGYEDFTATPAGKVEQGKAYPITVDIANFDSDKVAVWIDYNQDGVFTTDEMTTLSPAAVSTGSVSVPGVAKLGTTRMRVRVNYNTDPTPCGNTTFGQVEDYNVEVFAPGTLAVSDINKSKLSVYPNPFKDVLKISDVKDVTSVMVADLSGRTVAELKPATELNLSNLNKGVYIVSVKYTNGEVKVTKVIKE